MGMRVVPAHALWHRGSRTERVSVRGYNGSGMFVVDAQGLTVDVHRDALTFLPGAKTAVWDGIHDED